MSSSGDGGITKFANQRRLVQRQDGWVEVTVNNGRSGSEKTLALLPQAVFTHNMRVAATAASQQLETIKAEIETLRPHRKQHLDIQRAGIAAATAQFYKTSGR